jgi:hypothetical protein
MQAVLEEQDTTQHDESTVLDSLDEDSGSDNDGLLSSEANTEEFTDPQDRIDKYITHGGIVSTFKHKEQREQARERRKLKKCKWSIILLTFLDIEQCKISKLEKAKQLKEAETRVRKIRCSINIVGGSDSGAFGECSAAT